MARKVLTALEKATTPMTEAFLGNPLLEEQLMELAGSVGLEIPDCDNEILRYTAIAQAAHYLMVQARERDMEINRQRIKAQLAELGY